MALRGPAGESSVYRLSIEYLDNLAFMQWYGHDTRLASLLEDVIRRIPKRVHDEFAFFEVVEGPLPWGAHVDENNTVTLDPEKLTTDSRDVALGTIAHELAHVFLDHRARLKLDSRARQEDCGEADARARKWGFSPEITALRGVIGEPTLE